MTEIFGISLDLIPVITTLIISLATLLIKRLLFSDSLFRGSIQVSFENVNDMVQIHILNRMNKIIHIYGCFLSRTECFRFLCKTNFNIDQYKEISIKVDKKQLLSFGELYKKKLKLQDDFIPVKVILDSSQGRFYSQWAILDLSNNNCILKPHYGHKDPYYALRRRPAKVNMDLFVYLSICISDFFLFFTAQESLIKIGQHGVTILILEIIDIILLAYHSGYGFEKRRYVVYTSIVSLIPGIIFSIYSGEIHILLALVPFIYIFPITYGLSGWDLSSSTDSHYYIYDPYDNDGLNKDFEEARKNRGLWFQFTLLCSQIKDFLKNVFCKLIN